MVEVPGVQTSKAIPVDPYHCEVGTYSGNPRRALDPRSPARIMRRARTQLTGRIHPTRRHLPGLAISPTPAYDQPVDHRIPATGRGWTNPCYPHRRGLKALASFTVDPLCVRDHAGPGKDRSGMNRTALTVPDLFGPPLPHSIYYQLITIISMHALQTTRASRHGNRRRLR